MNETNLFTVNQVCEKLEITTFTLSNWYAWEKKLGEDYLPKPIILEHQKGKPRRWTEDMIEKLLAFKKTIKKGRYGSYGKFTNPNHKVHKN